MSDEMENRLRAYAERWQAAQQEPESATPTPVLRKAGVMLAAAVVAVTLSGAAIGMVGGHGGEQEVRTVAPAGVVPRFSDPAPTSAPTTPAPSASELSSQARAAADALVGFARSPNPATSAAVPFAPGRVHLALGPSTLASVDPAALAAVGGWEIFSTAYAEREGLFNAIQVLAQAESDLKITAGPHPSCPGPAPATPQEAAGLTQVSIQPADAPDCTRWFSIDLFLDREGRIAVVQLDLGSP